MTQRTVEQWCLQRSSSDHSPKTPRRLTGGRDDLNRTETQRVNVRPAISERAPASVRS